MNTETSFAPLLDLLVKSAALILTGTALLVAARKTSAANRHAVSAAIFVALLLLPFTKLLPARWSFALEKPAAPAVSVRLPLLASAPGGGDHPAVQRGENIAQPVSRAPLVIPWKKLAVAVWLTGATLLLARRALISLRLRNIVRRSFPIEDARLGAKVRSLVDAGGVRAEVRESDLCPVPLASGLVRPVVLLPAGAADWSDAFISSALRHELGHIRRRDCITRLFADVLCALYWVNPLVWFAARQMRLAQEQACDDLVLNAGAPASEYAEQLVEVVRSLQGDHFTARHALAMAQPSTLETRVLAIVDESRDRSARSVRGTFAGLAFAATALALCTAAQLRGADERKTAPAADATGKIEVQSNTATFDKKTGTLTASGNVKIKTGQSDTRWIIPKVDFQDAPLRDAVEYLSARSKKLDATGAGANIVIRNADKIGDAKITLTLSDVPLAEVLRYIAALAECEVVQEEFAFIIGPKQAAFPAAAKPAGTALKKAGTIIFPKIEFDGATLSEALDFLRIRAKDLDREKQGVNLILKADGGADTVKITLSLANVPLSEALRYVAALAGCEVVADEHAITIRPVAK